MDDPGAQLPTWRPFTDAEDGLLQALKQFESDHDLSGILKGAIFALQIRDNPETYVHAAQSARELIEKIGWVMLGTKKKKPGRKFEAKTNRYHQRWGDTKKKSRSFRKAVWQGKIDKPLCDFLGVTEDYFVWYAAVFSEAPKKENDEAVFRGLDSLFTGLSEKEQKLVIKGWQTLKEFFTNVAHHDGPPPTLEQMQDALARLVRYLHRQLAPVDALNKEAIRNHIQKWEAQGVTAGALSALPDLVMSGADSVFFFSSITKPEWLPVLFKDGRLSSPPPPWENKGTTLHPPWAVSRYLIKATPTNPAVAAEVIATMPETKNVNVNDDLFRAAALLPPENVGPTVKKMHRWLKTADVRWHSQDVANLISNAAKGGKDFAAIGMMEDVLSFSPPDEEKLPGIKRSDLAMWVDAKTRFSAHEYAEVVKKTFPIVARSHPMKALGAWCRILDSYIVARRLRDRRDPTNDSSFIWHPSIDESSQNSQFDEVTSLIDVCRDVIHEEMKAGRITLAYVLSVTKQFKRDLFRRMEMHWIRVTLDQATPDILEEALLVRKYVSADRFDLEYGQLLKAAFGKLGVAQKQTILGWILKGPTMPRKKSKRRKPRA